MRRDVYRDPTHQGTARIGKRKFVHQKLPLGPIAPEPRLDSLDGPSCRRRGPDVLDILGGELGWIQVKTALADQRPLRHLKHPLVRSTEVHNPPIGVTHPGRGRTVVHEGAEALLTHSQPFFTGSQLIRRTSLIRHIGHQGED